MLSLDFFPQRSGVGITSSGWIRGLLPFRFLPKHSIRAKTLQSAGQISLGAHPRDSVLFTQRTAIADIHDADVVLQKYRGRVVLDVDDDFLNFPETHPEYERYTPLLAAHRYLAERAALITASTEPLRASYLRVNPSVITIQNGIHLPLFRRNLFPKTRRSSSKHRFLYYGTYSHEEDFNLLLDALKAVPHFFLENELLVVGITRNQRLPPGVKRLEVPDGRGSYPNFIRWLGASGTFAGGFAPLVPAPFNDSKSDLKILELISMGVTPIASDYGPYKEWIDRGWTVDLNRMSTTNSAHVTPLGINLREARLGIRRKRTSRAYASHLANALKGLR